MLADISISAATWISTMVALFGLILAVGGMLIRIVSKWQRTEDRLEFLVEKVNDLVDDKESVHKQIVDSLTKLSDRVWEMQRNSRRFKNEQDR